MQKQDIHPFLLRRPEGREWGWVHSRFCPFFIWTEDGGLSFFLYCHGFYIIWDRLQGFMYVYHGRYLIFAGYLVFFQSAMTSSPCLNFLMRPLLLLLPGLTTNLFSPPTLLRRLATTRWYWRGQCGNAQYFSGSCLTKKKTLISI